MGIFVTALVVTLGLIFVVSKGSEVSRERATAGQIGRRWLERYSAYSYNDTNLVNQVNVLQPATFQLGSTSTTTVDYLVDVTVTPHLGPPNYKSVLVRVHWITDASRELKVETCIGDY